jgi:hypothetical protein
MYTSPNFKTKSALKQAIKDGKEVRVFQPNDIFGVGASISKGTHQVTLEGPHYPEPHTWYATAKIHDGILISIK